MELSSTQHRPSTDQIRIELDKLMDQLCHQDPLVIHRPAPLIGKVMFKAHVLGFSLKDGHAAIRRYFRSQDVRHKASWTESMARGAWELAERRQHEYL